MLRLYNGSGSQDIFRGDPALTDQQWLQIRAAAMKHFRARHQTKAAEYFERYPFRLFHGTNGFGDEFYVLHCALPFGAHAELAAEIAEYRNQHAFSTIADTVSGLIGYVRFVTADIVIDEPREHVPEPVVASASAIVEEALADARSLLAARGAASAVDRVHTALHGYMRHLCAQAELEHAPEASLTALFKLLRDRHPGLRSGGPRADDIDKVVRGLAAIADAANSIRNRATLAHANDSLLDEPEANLVVNAIRTLFNYLHEKAEAAQQGAAANEASPRG